MTIPSIEDIRVTCAKLDPAHRALAAIAMISGWSWTHPTHDTDGEPFADGVFQLSFRGEHYEGGYGEVSMVCILPEYFDDIAAVFEHLVPAMRERGWQALLGNADGEETTETMPLNGGWYRAVFWRGKSPTRPSRDLVDADHIDPAHAVCLAALRATGLTDGR